MIRLGLGLLLCSLLPGADWKKDILLRATFNKSIDAETAKGDAKLYTAPGYKEQAAAVPGLAGTDVVHENGALHFKSKNTKAVFFKAASNAQKTAGTVSFWLQLDPQLDLAPGFCDPIQVTDKDYNDSAMWVDFTKDEKPRYFRLGVFGELKAWNAGHPTPEKNPTFNNRLIVVKNPPFARGKWTHVAIAYSGLGTPAGKAELYVDGKTQGAAMSVPETFLWDESKTAIRLGVNYVGWMDDVTLIGRALSAEELGKLFRDGRK